LQCNSIVIILKIKNSRGEIQELVQGHTVRLDQSYNQSTLSFDSHVILAIPSKNSNEAPTICQALHLGLRAER
jgi:hypothetical protein